MCAAALSIYLLRPPVCTSPSFFSLGETEREREIIEGELHPRSDGAERRTLYFSFSVCANCIRSMGRVRQSGNEETKLSCSFVRGSARARERSLLELCVCGSDCRAHAIVWMGVFAAQKKGENVETLALRGRGALQRATLTFYYLALLT